jgi:predicted acyltransferase
MTTAGLGRAELGDVPAETSVTATATTLVQPRTASRRLHALDALRGAAILGMILVNNQGDRAHAFPGTVHAKWNGWAPADLVMPLFLFVVGASMVLSKRTTIASAARRAALLILLGLLLNLFPYPNLREVNATGVLQRIGLAYFLATVVVRYVPLRRQLWLAGGILVGFWAALAAWGSMTPLNNLPGAIDLAVLGSHRVYLDGTYNPNGLLSTLPSVVSVLAGYWAMVWVQDRKPSAGTALRLVGVGAACIGGGLLWGLVFPINKILWTSSFVVLTTGWSLVALGLMHYRQGAWWLEVLGLNAIVLYAGSEEMSSIFKDVGVRHGLWAHVFSPVFGDRLGSLVYALAFGAVWWLILYVMWRRRWFVKI